MQIGEVNPATISDQRGQWCFVQQTRDDLCRTVPDSPHDRTIEFLPYPVRSIRVSGPHEHKGIECSQAFVKLARNRVTCLDFPLIEPDVNAGENQMGTDRAGLLLVSLIVTKCNGSQRMPL